MVIMKITVIYGSSRKNGNSELLANTALNGIRYDEIYLADLHINQIVDQRHEKDGFTVMEDDFDQIIRQLLQTDILILATPIYWYSMSGMMKNMVDRLSQAIRDKRYPSFAESIKSIQVIVLAVGGDKPRQKGLPMIQQFQYIFDFLQMAFCHWILAEGNRPEEVLKDKKAIYEALQLNAWLQKQVDHS